MFLSAIQLIFVVYTPFLIELFLVGSNFKLRHYCCSDGYRTESFDTPFFFSMIFMRVPPLVCLCFFPGVFVSSRVTGACPVTTDLIMRVNVRTTTNIKISKY